MMDPDPPLPPWLRFLDRSRLNGAIPRGVGATRPRFGVDGSRVASREERERTQSMPTLLERIQRSAVNVGRQVAENPVRTIADLTPGISDALAVKDAFEFAKGGQPWMAGLAAASVLPGVPSIAKKVKKSGFDEVVSNPRTALAQALIPRHDEALSVLHNTDWTKVGKIAGLGGIPAPSLAIVRADAPFKHYGDVSLIGTADMVDPKVSPVSVFDGDAYTARQPAREIRPADPEAAAAFARSIGRKDADSWDLRRLLNEEGPARRGAAGQIAQDAQVQMAYLRSRGIEPPAQPLGLLDPNFDGNNLELYQRIRAWERELKDAFQGLDYPENYALDRRFGVRPHEVATQWLLDQSEGLAGGPAFRDPTGAYRPYELDQLAESMTRGRVRLREDGNEIGAGQVAARQLRQLRSIPELRRAAAARLRDEAAEKAGKGAAGAVAKRALGALGKQVSGVNVGNLQRALYDVPQGGGPDKVEKALRSMGWDVTPEGVAAAQEYLQAIRDVPQAYFEAKPRRPVRLEEFPGAVVPEAHAAYLRPLLEERGMKVSQYGRNGMTRQWAVEDLRRDLAKRGHRTLFELGAVAAAGLAAKYGLSLSDPELDDL